MRSFSIVRLRRWAKLGCQAWPAATPQNIPPTGAVGLAGLDCTATTDPLLKQVVADANEAEESIPLDLYLPSGRLAT